MKGVGSLIIGYNFTNGKDKSILIVGTKTDNADAEIINAFQGKEAEELYLKLVTLKEQNE